MKELLMMLKYILSFLLILVTYSLAYSNELNFNNGSENQYNEASELSGSNKFIQSKTKGLWPRKREGKVYSVGENKVKKRENKQF